MAYKTRVLFVCTANAARSQMAEALLRHTDSDNFEAHSAGSQPGEVDPRALAALQHLGVSTEGLHSKGLDAFHWNDFEYVISLCDKASQECQHIPFEGQRLAWHFEDPVTSSQPEAFRHCLHEIHERIKMFVLVKTKR
ncbi:arsenate reductase ArsC [Pseudomonas sp. NPDC077186]|uniref:arsenate reductase ArsC n=1 Tax=Pseudomonas sp. NPDC077186 TaxID=3364421 RepID=UPI0037CA61AA